MEKIKIYIDCDGVIFDTIGYVKEKVKELGFEPTFWNMNKYYIQANWKTLIEEAGILNDSVKKIHELIASGEYDIFGLTKLSIKDVSKEVNESKGFDTDEYSELYKIYILQFLFPETPILYLGINDCKEKVVDPSGKILVDDSIRNIRAWVKAGGIGILFSPYDSEDYEYDFPEDPPITDEETEYMIHDLSELRDLPCIKELKEQLQYVKS